MGQRIGLRSDNTLSHTDFHGLGGELRRFGIGLIQRIFHTWHPVGDQALAYLTTLSGCQRPNYRFAYAVDNDWFAAQSSESRRNRAKFLDEQGWPWDAFVVLGIMKWAQREDPLTLVAAFRQLRARVARARLILVGDGPLKDAVTAACRPLGNSVLCPGYAAYSTLPYWYGLADAFVHPAPDEPWGVSVTESLACGVPVIAADGVGAAHEALLSDTCGAVFPNGEASVLASKLEAYAASPFLREQCEPAAKNAADRWHYRHTIEAFQRALQDI
ncbi:MAG: glycosyltransferase family 4 protein [Cyanobacteriota bacterium]|nr:glycosyltransferase family 4 protein [Cyanobacteriota bacterium]